MSWLFLNEIRDLDKGPDECDIFFSSKGHDAPALYSVLIGLGLLPADKLHQLRRLHGLPGHPHVETPYIQANTGSLGMGISKAKGMALANRLAGAPRRIFVLTGDGELQEGQFWESLRSAESDHRRHGQGTRGLVHGGSCRPDGGRSVPVPLRRASRAAVHRWSRAAARDRRPRVRPPRSRIAEDGHAHAQPAARAARHAEPDCRL